MIDDLPKSLLVRRATWPRQEAGGEECCISPTQLSLPACPVVDVERGCRGLCYFHPPKYAPPQLALTSSESVPFVYWLPLQTLTVTAADAAGV